MTKKYRHTTLGGTFDHLHAGHRKLLNVAFENADKVTVEVTTQALLRDKRYKSSIQSFDERKQEVEQYLNSQSYTDYSIIPLDDVYGTTRTDAALDALVVSEETETKAREVLQERLSRGLPPLSLIIVPLVKTASGIPLSSTAIREGLMDREGFLFTDLFSKDLAVSEEKKDALREPIGMVVKEDGISTSELAKKVKDSLPNDSIIVAVGDIVSQSLQEVGLTPTIAIVDLHSRRQALSASEPYTVKNPAGTIRSQAVTEIRQALEKSSQNHRIVVEGEEDLLALPAIMLAPLRSTVIYGQYGLGVVVVEVTEESKRKVQNLLSLFTVSSS